MGMNITDSRTIGSTNYSITSDAKKVDNKNEVNSDAAENQAVTQELGKDTFVKSEEDDKANLNYKPIKKKLSTEEVKALNEEQENMKIDLMKKFVNDTIKNQSKLLGKSIDGGDNELSQESTDLLTKIFGSVEKAYPPIATTQEGAKQAIAEGGPYSVNAVADSIMTMAKAIAGDDQEKIQEMRDAVEKGFSKAGLEFKNATESDLPQICKDTHTEVMKRFDELQNKTNSTNDNKEVTNNNK